MPKTRREFSARVEVLSGMPSRAKRSAWRFRGWCWPYFSNSSMARTLGPAQPRGTTWNGAGGCVIRLAIPARDLLAHGLDHLP